MTTHQDVYSALPEAKAARLRVDEYIREFNSDPMHWSNNKRRRMGMKPLRKPIKTSRASTILYEPMMRIVEDLLREVVPKVTKELFDTFADVSQIAKEGHKAILGSSAVPGALFEFTYNGDKDEAYLDVYGKHENVVVKP